MGKRDGSIRALLILALELGGLGCANEATSDEPPRVTTDAAAGDHEDAGAEPGERGEPEAICDGSEQIRFGNDALDSASISFDPFYENYGLEFFFVRGDCRYVRGGSSSSQRAFGEGTLSAAQAEQLAREFDFATLGERFVREKDNLCFDGAIERLHGASSTFRCRCCGLSYAMGNFLDELLDDETPVHSAVTAVAIEVSNPEPDPMRASWPTVGDIDEIILPGGRYKPGPMDGHRFDDPYDAAALRALREAQRTERWIPPNVKVQDEGRVFDVFVRDELPATIEAPVRALLAERER